MKLALGWYRNAADKGEAAAMFAIGQLYEHGRGVKRDPEQASRWYRKAAERDDADAKAALRRLGGK